MSEPLTDGQIERARLEAELAALRMQQPFPTAEGIAEHQDRIARLQMRLAQLPPLPRMVTHRDSPPGAWHPGAVPTKVGR
jgi:hypothetical protein